VAKTELLSVGIDVGTTTTQFQVSHLLLEDTSGAGVKISDKETVYRGSVHLTPLLSEKVIDLDSVIAIIEQEYHMAGISTWDVDTGVIILTGQTAGKQNAEEVAQRLSEFAGDFVAYAAGPDLESVLSSRGAGVPEFSKSHGATIHFDVGGGTSNFAHYAQGKLQQTGCFDIGGRLLQMGPDGKVIAINDKIMHLCQTLKIPLLIGEFPDPEALRYLVDAMVQILEMGLGLREKTPYYSEFLTTPGKDITPPPPNAWLLFSGGVADMIYSSQERDWQLYHDIGPLLSNAIRRSRIVNAFRLSNPAETIRATVVGACSHSTSLSGNTISIDTALLPLKNLPLIDYQSVHDSILTATWPVALYISGEKAASFQRIQELAKGIIQWHTRGDPLVVVCEHDIAKALGQAIRALHSLDKLICIDSIIASDGDKIDIGCPVGNWDVLPVVVKTLIFG
jgi:ethanolamine utilization protein EutA